MRPYQLQGLNWLVSLHHNSLNGILADEMVRSYCDLVKFLIFTAVNHVGPWKNSPNHIFSCLSQTPTLTSRPTSCRCAKIDVAELGARI